MRNRRERRPIVRHRSVNRRSAITAKHLEKHANVYVRTATVNRPPPTAQRTFVARARKWGWRTKQVRIIEDLGRSGLSDRRPGFKQLQALLDAGAVGAVLVRDPSRTSRDPVQLQRFLRKAQQARVSVLANGHVLDPATTAKMKR